jgi:hypothetical protein
VLGLGLIDKMADMRQLSIYGEELPDLCPVCAFDYLSAVQVRVSRPDTTPVDGVATQVCSAEKRYLSLVSSQLDVGLVSLR